MPTGERPDKRVPRTGDRRFNRLKYAEGLKASGDGG
jgi:hypothetical protein